MNDAESLEFSPMAANAQPDYPRGEMTEDKYRAWLEREGAKLEREAQRDQRPLETHCKGEPITHPEVFAPLAIWTQAEQVMFEMRRVAMAIVLGTERRPLRALAREVGCSKSALEKHANRICRVLGIERYRSKGELARKHYREARQRTIAATQPAHHEPAQPQAQTPPQA